MTPATDLAPIRTNPGLPRVASLAVEDITPQSAYEELCGLGEKYAEAHDVTPEVAFSIVATAKPKLFGLAVRHTQLVTRTAAD